jgi:hypothetical protein
MADLSPAAQAVLDAYIQGLATKRRNAIAAALRSAADQVTPTDKNREDAPKAHSQVFFSGMEYAALELRAIAAELEGQAPVSEKVAS